MEPSILNVEVSAFANYKDTTPQTINLLDWLKDDTFKARVEAIRKNENKAERDKLKAGLPAVTVSGLFSERNKAGLIKHSGLMCIDIDYKDNKHIGNFNDLKDILSTAPFVAYCGLSVSGTGFFAIIPIRYPEKHEQHFEALRELFKEKLTINIDVSCKDVSRLRGYSYNNERSAFICHNVSPFAFLWQPPKMIVKPFKIKNKGVNTGNRGRVEALILEICSGAIDLTPTYNDWFIIGNAFANEFGENGRDYFVAVSQFYPGYSDKETNENYTKWLKKGYNQITIGSFFHLCKVAGISCK